MLQAGFTTHMRVTPTILKGLVLFMTLNNTCLRNLECEVPFELTPEQKNILLLWFGSDSKFGWTKLDFMLGIHRVRRLYPDHRAKSYKGPGGLLSERALDFYFDFDRADTPTIYFVDDDELPF